MTLLYWVLVFPLGMRVGVGVSRETLVGAYAQGRRLIIYYY